MPEARGAGLEEVVAGRWFAEAREVPGLQFEFGAGLVLHVNSELMESWRAWCMTMKLYSERYIILGQRGARLFEVWARLEEGRLVPTNAFFIDCGTEQGARRVLEFLREESRGQSLHGAARLHICAPSSGSDKRKGD